MKIPGIAKVLAKAFAAKVGVAATELAVETISAQAGSLTGSKPVDLKRLKRHVLKIQKDLAAVESGIGAGAGYDDLAEAAIKLHDTLFVGLTVLEDEIGEQLLPAPGGVSTRSGGSGKDRPDVSAE